jgi:hypothetical protein
MIFLMVMSTISKNRIKNKTELRVDLGHEIAQAVSRWLPTEAARV